MRRFAARPAPQFENRNRSRRPARHIRCMARQDAAVSPREAVFGKNSNRLEQRAAHLVVEILRWKLFLAGTAQAQAHVLGEPGEVRVNRYRRGGRLHKRTDNWVETSCETTGGAARTRFAASRPSARNAGRRRNSWSSRD